jgi:amino acid transporter/nucleotide-binding universal stress UspA family protein
MADKTQVSSELSRELSLFHITMMGLGMMIGAGVFLGVGNSIFMAGPGGATLTFALNGVIAMFTALSYAELSSAIPRAGGAYNYARTGFGRGTSFLAGWLEWFASTVAGSLYAVTFAIYMVRYLEVLGLLNWTLLPTPVNEKIVSILIAGFFLYINYRGASETGKIGAFFTLGQTIFLLFIGIVGIFVALKDPFRFQNFNPFLPYGWSKLLITMGFTYVAFEGYEVIAQTGDEAIDPSRNLPKAMIYSVFIVTISYVAVAFATVVAVRAGSPGIVGLPWQWIGQFRERGFGEAISRLMPMGNLLLTLAVIFASTSALNATIYSATRASYALGRDNMLPNFFAKISRKQKTPWAALLVTGAILIFVATALPTMDVASSASIMFLILFFLVNLCVIKVRLNLGDELDYGFLMPFFPIFPVIAIICQAILAVWLVHMSLIAWIVAPVWTIAGIIIYHLYSKSHAKTTAEEIQVLEEEEAPEGDEYRVMVAVANPKNSLELVRTTYNLCKAKNARVELLHMVPVPEQVPLTDAQEYMMEGKEAIVEAMLYLIFLFPISTTIRYCRNIARGIVSAIREKKIDMLIMGWHGQQRTYGFKLGSTIDPIIERSPCNVVIMKNCWNANFKRILVPVIGGPNGAFALEIASILADKDEGKICAYTVHSEKSKFNIENFVEAHKDKISLPLDKVTIKAIIAPAPVEAILNEAKDYDLIVLGCTRDPFIYQIVRESIPDIVARKCNKPLVMVKASGGIRSWIKRWF